VRLNGKFLGSFDTTCIVPRPKFDKLETFNEFRPISLCNRVYKIISKVLVVRLKRILSKVISLEQFGFSEGKKIHETIGSTQE